MKAIFKAQSFRLILVLMSLASSALVVEAGQRWLGR
jgi:hypothetical protein